MCTEAEYAAAALTLLQQGGFPHRNLRTKTDGTVLWEMRCSEAGHYREMCGRQNIAVSVGAVRGFPVLRARYAGRIGIPLGALLFAGIVWLSGAVVWRVDVTGNRRFDAETIRRELADFGFGVGSFFGGIDFDELQNSFLLRSQGLAWIAVNMEGTVAHVEVREFSEGTEVMPEVGRLANITAAEDGQIMEVRVRGGRAEVGVNDVVRRGELLISGIMAVGEDGVRYEYAAGEVIARVNRRIVGESPLSAEKAAYTGRESTEIALFFFGKEMIFYRKSSIEGGTYDTIVSEKQAAFPDGTVLPFAIRRRTRREYRMERVPLSEEEALRAARSRYRASLRDLAGEVDILSLESETVVGKDTVQVIGNAVCAANIAITAEIPLN